MHVNTTKQYEQVVGNKSNLHTSYMGGRNRIIPRRPVKVKYGWPWTHLAHQKIAMPLKNMMISSSGGAHQMDGPQRTNF